MKVLLLSCNTGEGHNSAARAIAEELGRRGIENVKVDPLSFLSEWIEKTTSHAYNSLIKHTPKAFGVMYKTADIISETKVSSPVYYLRAGYAKKLHDYIVDNGFDAVISVHLFGMEAMAGVRKTTGLDIPFYGVMTDYTVYPFTAESKQDGYFASHPELAEALAEKGIDPTIIHPTGIPVRAAFAETMPQSEAREYLDLPQDKKMLLVMTGGVGCEPMLKLCDKVVEAAGGEAFACVMVGKNEDLRQKIEGRYGKNGAVRAIPFTTEVNLYMKAADVLITKPGGLSSTEAAVANVPLVHVREIPGCETDNVRFFGTHGLSLAADSDEQAVEYALKLAHDPTAATAMRQAQRATINPFAARDIVRIVCGK